MSSTVQFDTASSRQFPGFGSPAAAGGTSARETAEWWAGLPAVEQQAFALTAPGDLGALDGLPADVRHQISLAALRADAASGNDRRNAQALLDRVEQSWDGPGNGRIYLLGYDAPGPGGSPDAKVVASIGNADSADNVAVYVPGATADLGGMGGFIDEMAALRAEAEMIPGSGETATIVWLGYDAPDSLMAASQSSYARSGAEALGGFIDGLQEASTTPDARHTVIGHSYGAAVVGTADALGGRGLAVDDVVALGSAGMGYEAAGQRQGWFDSPRIDSIGEMHIDKEHFWAGATINDVVTYTSAHGNNPVNWSFGGQRIATTGASGHFQYWDPGTESLRNQAYVLTGNYDQVSKVTPRFG